VLRAPPGTVVEVCYSQALIDGKASPYHPLCGSKTCYMDRYTIGASIAAGETVTLTPLEPRGCRYIEVHAVCDDDVGDLADVDLIEATALFRCYDEYHAEPLGTFQCAPADTSTGTTARGTTARGTTRTARDASVGGISSTRTAAAATADAADVQGTTGTVQCTVDAVDSLDLIWKTGSDTTRSCVEDSCVDGPCRERGQWTGDTLAVSLPNLVYMYDDIRPALLTLLQTSAAADTHGVVSGNCPEGGSIADYAYVYEKSGEKEPATFHCMRGCVCVRMCAVLHTQ
jgi:hypothetical protein